MDPNRYPISIRGGVAAPANPPQRDQTSNIPRPVKIDDDDHDTDIGQPSSFGGGNQASTGQGWDSRPGSFKNGSQQGPHQPNPHQQIPHQQNPHQQDPHQQDPHQQDPHQQDPHQQDPHQQDPHQQNPHQQSPHQHLEDQYRSILRLCQTAKTTVEARYRQSQAHIQSLNQDLLMETLNFHNMEEEANHWKQKYIEKEKEADHWKQRHHETAVFAQTLTTWTPIRHHALEKIMTEFNATFHCLQSSIDNVMRRFEINILDNDIRGEKSGIVTEELQHLYELLDKMMTEAGHYRALQKWLRELAMPPWLRQEL
ncbi:hypothetical protein RRF57_012154 [Xylaria bambusicola]|uniref:Uncharacterized protein n=1 Tax=Xylaria bambusicola TaxID=326684 RepID=A0AAN7ZAG6_9PEZI